MLKTGGLADKIISRSMGIVLEKRKVRLLMVLRVDWGWTGSAHFRIAGEEKTMALK